jgi:hypothetical protein
MELESKDMGSGSFQGQNYLLRRF